MTGTIESAQAARKLPGQHSVSAEPPATSTRRKVVAVLVVVVAVLAIGGIVAWRTATSSPSTAQGANGAVATTTAKVEKRTLTKTDPIDGTLDYAESRPVVNQRAGTLTSAPDVGTVIERGQPLYTVDTKPVILMYGETPTYRQIDGTASPGPDIRQLKQNLVDLGFGTGITVDETFDAAAAYDLGQWETSVGLDGDGLLQLGEVVFVPGSVRMHDLKLTLGSTVPVGNEAIGVTSTTKVVTAALDASHVSLVKQGDKVGVTLPNGKAVTGNVESVGPKSAASAQAARSSAAGAANGQGSTSSEAVVALGDDAGKGVDTGPVKVSVTSSRAEGVKAVPVTALVALAEGGYAVQLADTGKLVPAKPGLVADNWVEIASDVPEGASVVVPR